MTTIEAIMQKISQSIANTYAILFGMGATPPAEETSDYLAETAGTVKVVRFDAQELDAEQQAQARENIGAASEDAVGDIETAVDEILAAQSIYIGALDEVIALQNSYIDGGESA